MIYLLLVSIIWAFSFGLIKGNLTGLDSNFVAFARLFISFLVFLPFIKFKKTDGRTAFHLIFTGSIQFGIMYLSYIYSYQFLKAYEIAVFTIFTPLYITLINDLYQKKFNKLFFITSVLSIVGAAVIVYQNFERANFITGFLILQISNICFAFGQIFYKKIMSEKSGMNDRDIFGFLYLGAVAITLLFSLFTTDYSELNLNMTQIYSILYLGIVASGIGFFLWNYGARKTDAGALAIFNNLKIPLGVAASIFIFGEDGNIMKLLIGFIIIASALLINEKYKGEVQ